MLCLLIYLFSISLDLYFFICLSPISICTVNSIRILRIFCYLNISEKIIVNKFSAQQIWNLRLRVSILLVLMLSPCVWGSQHNKSPTCLLLKLPMFMLIMPLPQSSWRGTHNFHSHSSLACFCLLFNMLISTKKMFCSQETSTLG